MHEPSHALPAHCYRNPSDVAEQNELNEMGCKACESHAFLLGRVVCSNASVTNHKRVPHIGKNCKYFKLEER